MLNTDQNTNHLPIKKLKHTDNNTIISICHKNPKPLTIVSPNAYGAENTQVFINDLSYKFNIICLQETWATTFEKIKNTITNQNKKIYAKKFMPSTKVDPREA